METNMRVLVIDHGIVLHDLSDVYHVEVRNSTFKNESATSDNREYLIKAHGEKMSMPESKQDVDELAKTKDYTIDVDQA